MRSDAGIYGELIVQAKAARKEYRLALGRWKRMMTKLTMKRAICAHAFKAYLADLTEKHVLSKPILAFTYEEASVENGQA